MSHFNYKICERFAPIFLRRTHVKIVIVPTKLRRILEFITFSESLSVIKIVRVPTFFCRKNGFSKSQPQN
ncbi:hypothetical protein LEP1GSC186_2728 [Leptospira noguchii serovar Autumnalis str. ZUN142]|uniref:Uncharacterized protein n=1 Tax=Leptospira noguchii serovar Autumnalis str. ZUN142 TaxID=1085540 RepID=M6U161_9LEPT|nr:hypothetical protein LEP1GSC186_2728 [Leptospira noguchii serovar Autumnalis str. ZUN142]